MASPGIMSADISEICGLALLSLAFNVFGYLF
jgi:hypothetical protein